MTDMSREPERASGSPSTPLSVDVLADLQAGVLDEHEAAELWPRVNADPEARAILDALAATTADLSGLAAEPAPPMPAHVAERIEFAITREAEARGGNVVSLDAARKRRNRRVGMGAGFLTAAAAAIAAVMIAVPSGDNELDGNVAAPTPTTQAEAPTGTETPNFDSGNMNAAIGQIEGLRDFGALENEERFNACIEAGGMDPAVRPEGIGPAKIDGKDAVIALYTTGKLAQFRLIALSADCGPDNPGLLMDKIVGRK